MLTWCLMHWTFCCEHFMIATVTSCPLLATAWVLMLWAAQFTVEVMRRDEQRGSETCWLCHWGNVMFVTFWRGSQSGTGSEIMILNELLRIWIFDSAYRFLYCLHSCVRSPCIARIFRCSPCVSLQLLLSYAATMWNSPSHFTSISCFAMNFKHIRVRWG